MGEAGVAARRNRGTFIRPAPNRKAFSSFRAFTHSRFPERRKGRPKWKSHEFLPARSVCAVLVLSYARLRIRGFLRGPRSEVNF